MPITFRGRISSGGDDGFDRVGGGVSGVTGHVGGAGGVTGGTGGGAGRTFIDGAGGGVGGNCSGACCAIRYPAARPGAPCLNGFARSVVSRVFLLKEWKHMFGAIGGPECKQPLIPLVGMLDVFNLYLTACAGRAVAVASGASSFFPGPSVACDSHLKSG